MCHEENHSNIVTVRHVTISNLHVNKTNFYLISLPEAAINVTNWKLILHTYLVTILIMILK